MCIYKDSEKKNQVIKREKIANHRKYTFLEF